LAEELDKTFGLMRLADELVELLLSNHYDTFLALARDALRTLGTRAAKDFAETSFGALNLPGITGKLLVIDGSGNSFVP
jgi:hypothetical protein